jgi:hypothetical protein
MKKMFIVALIVASAFVACGGKKKDNTMKPGSGSAMGSDMGSAAGSGDGGSGSAAPEGGGSGG